jgi:asparagine synthase (glutamine-hydrolysing)
MCGIAGRINYVSGKPVAAPVITGMCDLLAHRGPDGSGAWTRGHAGLGHRRLAIIDLSEAGAQPMSTADGEIWLTFNGEIYNFLELRAQLEARGHRFRSHTDSEVILYAYREYGVDCVDHLRGMFAFAIWDEPRRRLLLARDRAGKKPLFYRTDADGIAFASEPKAFLAESGFTPTPDPVALSAYLTYQYVPSPMSAFAGVKKLPPAHCLLVENGHVSVRRYWKLSYATKSRLTEQEAVEELGVRLREAVKIRLMSDVPLGAFLSGGIDSGAVVALMSELGAGPVRTFSIGFEQKEYDELQYARLVAERYGTRHEEFVVRPDALEILPRLIWHYGEPFADSSAIPTFLLAELTRRHVTVALNGDAGDENFAGYERYRANVLATKYDAISPRLRGAVDLFARLIPASGNSGSVLSKGKRFLEVLGEGRERRYLRWMAHFQPLLKAELCRAEFQESAGPDSSSVLLESYAASDAPDFVDATLDVDVNNYLPDDLLVKVDIATMAHGLEARSPLLDHPLMEFAASLPSGLKLNGSIKKYILKEAVKPLLPREIIERPKMGFGVPLEHWFRHELKEMAYDVLLSDSLRQRGYFHESVIRRLLDEHSRGVRSWHYQLWNLLMFESWHRMFVDLRPRASPDSVQNSRVMAGA